MTKIRKDVYCCSISLDPPPFPTSLETEQPNLADIKIMSGSRIAMFVLFAKRQVQIPVKSRSEHSSQCPSMVTLRLGLMGRKLVTLYTSGRTSSNPEK